jgi:hypothetical protein
MSQPSITWQRVYGGPDIGHGRSIVQTPDSGYIAVGSYRISPYEYLYILKLNVYGDTVWTRKLNLGEGTDIEKASDGNYVISTFYSFAVKINIFGDTLWTYRPFSSTIYTGSVKETQDGGYILCGTCPNGPFTASPYLLKLNQSGKLQWDTAYTKGIFDGGFGDVTLSNDANLVMVGSYADTATSTRRLFLLKTDSLGNYILFKRFDTLTYHSAHTIISLNNNGYIIGGDAVYPFMLKVNEGGDILWYRIFNAGNPSFILSAQLIKTYDGGYAFTGMWDTIGNSTYFVYLFKTDSLGIEQWHRSFGFNDNDRGRGIKQTFDSGYVIIGDRGRYNFGEIYIVKADKTGFANPIGIKLISYHPANNFDLYQNYPNPFNSSTLIRFEVNEATHVRLTIYEATGREIRTLVDHIFKPGNYAIKLDASNYASGIYFYSLYSNNFVSSRKMVLLK